MFQGLSSCFAGIMMSDCYDISLKNTLKTFFAFQSRLMITKVELRLTSCTHVKSKIVTVDEIRNFNPPKNISISISDTFFLNPYKEIIFVKEI